MCQAKKHVVLDFVKDEYPSSFLFKNQGDYKWHVKPAPERIVSWMN